MAISDNILKQLSWPAGAELCNGFEWDSLLFWAGGSSAGIDLTIRLSQPSLAGVRAGAELGNTRNDEGMIETRMKTRLSSKVFSLENL